jgi:hypothetical protein
MPQLSFKRQAAFADLPTATGKVGQKIAGSAKRGERLGSNVCRTGGGIALTGSHG